MNQRNELEQAIANLEAQRAILGDMTVDAAIVGIRAQLATLEPATDPKRQRKQVTVLFADVSGFTAMSETMDAEDVNDVMNSLWERVDRAILDHNGRIDKHIGDAVMALWGVDEAREDDPEQAILAALAMQTAIRDFASENDVALQMRVGLNTGPVLLGEVGTTAEFTAMGDTVNTASRLEHAAPVGGILISHDTYQHVRGVFDAVLQAPLTVKGKVEPLQVYVIQRAKPRAFRMGRRGIEGIETRTIGRERELQVLQEAYETAVREKETTVVTIAGDAGVGKSRLLYEFDKWIELRPEQLQFFKGRAFQQTQGVPHYLWRDLLAHHFQILDSDPLPVVREKFTTGFTAFLPDDAEMTHVTMRAHILGSWLGYDFSHSPHLKLLQDDPEQLQNRATLYLTQLFAAIGAQQPTLIFLEDIHWADGGSLMAVTDLVRRQSQLPLLVICVTRPTLFKRLPDWGEKIPAHTYLELAPLTGTVLRALVAEILRRVEPLPPLLVDLVSSRAEGNPFYVEELVKMLIDDGILITTSEPWQVMADKLLKLEVPATLTGVLQARLDRLDPEQKRTAQQASVIGRVFWDQALAALSQEQEPALPSLLDREFIYPQAESAFADTAAYRFKHALLRDVTYETVLKQARRTYHGLIAGWLVAAAEANGRSDEYAAVIGEHYYLAQNEAQAALWYGRVGQKAAATFAHQEAIHYLSLALDLAPASAPADRFAYLAAREKMYSLQGKRAAQQADLAQLAQLATQLDRDKQAWVALSQAGYYVSTSNFESAIDRAQAAITLAEACGAWGTAAGGYAVWGPVLWRQKQYARAQEVFQMGIAVARKGSSREHEAKGIRGLGVVAYYQGDYAMAVAYYEQSLAIEREIGDPRGEQACLSNLGSVAETRGDYDAAASFYEQALIISRETGSRYGEGLCLRNVGGLALLQGNYETATTYLEPALTIFREIGSPDRVGETINLLGLLALSQNNPEQATIWLQQSLTIRQELNLSYFLVEDWVGLAKAAFNQGDKTQTETYLLQILAYLQENPTLAGADTPMRVFQLTWELLVALGQTDQAGNILNLATQIMQDYLDKNSKPALQKLYLNQPHHKVLWNAWQEKRGLHD